MDELLRLTRILFFVVILVLLLAGTSVLIYFHPELLISNSESRDKLPAPKVTWWTAPDTTLLRNDEEGKLIRYGRDLIVRTSRYLGPKGSVNPQSNGMNCQNCHLDAGTKVFANNFGSVASLYPKFRARSGGKESIEKRVNDCMERSLNGKPLDSLSKEMRAMVAYMMWVGKEVPKGKSADGASFVEMKWLDRAADPKAGQLVYESKCKSCHAPPLTPPLEGIASAGVGAGEVYPYPPLWGDNSFNTAAGLYRISNFARYVRANMPIGATFEQPMLSEEEAWDVAAYVISLPRPHKVFPTDWPKLELKPVDHPFGPFADKYSEERHKYGPFREMLKK